MNISKINNFNNYNLKKANNFRGANKNFKTREQTNKSKKTKAIGLLSVGAALALAAAISVKKGVVKKLFQNKKYNLKNVFFDKNSNKMLTSKKTALTGTVEDTLKSGNRIKMRYENGVLQESVKYNSNGEIACTKVYSQKEKDSGVFKSVQINRTGENPKIITTHKKEKIRNAGLVEINPETNEKIEKMRLMSLNDGLIVLDGRNDSTSVIKLQNNADPHKKSKKQVLFKSESPFPTITETANTKDGYSFKSLDFSALNNIFSKKN